MINFKEHLLTPPGTKKPRLKIMKVCRKCKCHKSEKMSNGRKPLKCSLNFTFVVSSVRKSC